MTLSITDYRAPLALDVIWKAPPPSEASLDATVVVLVEHFAAEAEVALDPSGKPPIDVMRALLTRRPDAPIPPEIQAMLDDVLQGLKNCASPVAVDTLSTIAERFRDSPYPAGTRTYLWRGDITRLATDAIVNAANAEMMGCFIPFHACIDNAIHWAAGPRLRAECGYLMRLQNHLEPTGVAKATRAYNLPSRFVLHTVGPIVRGRLSPADAAALASSYRACLDLAAELPDVRSLAFCSVSTGVFGFPKREAARVALDTVAAWMAEDRHPDLQVVFNVFGADDERIYAEALQGEP